MSVLSEENTNMLFGLFDDIINENNEKISINDKTQLKQFITQQCYYYHNKRFDFSNDINEMNKKIIDSSFGYYNQMIEQKKALKKREEESKKRQQQVTAQFKNNMQSVMPNMMDRPVNIVNTSNITLEYEKQKNDFNSHIKPKQKEIDFTDPNKDKPINNLDIIMNQTLADRQKELMQITQQYNNTKQTKEWLNTKINNKSDFTPSEPIEILKIDKSSDLKLETQEIKKQEKRVTFNIEEPVQQSSPASLSMSSLLSKLKKKQEPENLNKKEPENLIKQEPENLNQSENKNVWEKLNKKESENLNKKEIAAISDNLNAVLINQNKENKQYLQTIEENKQHLETIIEKLNIVILNQENLFKEVNNIKSNQDKILIEVNEFKNSDLPPI